MIEYKVNSIEIMISVPKFELSYDDAKCELEKDLRDPDMILDYNMAADYELDEIDHDDETDEDYLFRVVYILKEKA